MKTLLATLFVLLNTSSIAQELPDSVLNIKWNVDQITTSEHSISLDTIIEWMMGKDLTVSIEQKTTKCVTDSLEMKYILRTSVCNSCSYQFNVKGNKVSGCVCWCQMVLCTDGKGNLSGRGKLEEILMPVLCKAASISVQENRMKLITKEGAEVLLKK